METKNIALTEQEANVLVQMLHIVLQAKGLEGSTADNVIHFRNKIQEAFKEPEIEEVKEKKSK